MNKSKDILVFVDVNVILDVLLKRPRLFHSSFKALNHAIDNGEIYISALSVHILVYFCKKFNIKLNLLKRFIEGINILPLLSETVFMGFDVPNLDYEDVLQFLTAKDCGCNIIITRNFKDFVKIQRHFRTSINVYSPQEYIKNFISS